MVLRGESALLEKAATTAGCMTTPTSTSTPDEAIVTAKRWTDSPDAKQRRMAEVLVPSRVPPSFIRGAYVPDDDAAQRLQAHLGGRSLPIRVHPWLFFGSQP